MKKIALTTAAFLLTAGAAFAQSAVAPAYNDAGYLPTDNASSLSTQSAHGISVPAGNATVVAPKYDDAGRLPTDVPGARSTAIKPAQAGTGLAVAPAYNDAGYLPTDAR